MAQDTRFAAATVPHLKTLTRSERGAAAAGSATTPSPERRHHHVVSARRCPSADPHRRTRGGSWRKKVTFRSTPSRSYFYQWHQEPI